MRFRQVGFLLLMLVWLFVIFGFSNQNAKNSQSLSDKVTIKMIDFYTKVTKKEIAQNDKNKLVVKLRFWVRKTAHFTIYLILGILVYGVIKSFHINKFIMVSILLCLCFSCTDEFHQHFVDSRTPQVLDIAIDTVGASFGINLAYLLHKIVKKKHII